MRGYLRGTWGELSGGPNAFLQALAEVSGQHQRPRSGAVTPPPRWSGASPRPRPGLGRPPLAARIMLGAERLIPRAAADAAAPKPLAQRFLRRHLASRICIQGPV